jgi:hypothetical protein
MRIGWVVNGREIDPSTGTMCPPEAQETPDGLHSNFASVRYRMLIPMKALAAKGHRTALLAVNAELVEGLTREIGRFDALVFKKTLEIGRFQEQLLERAKAARIPVLFDICDARIDPSTELGTRNRRMARAADRVVTSTPALAELLHAVIGRAPAVISEPYEGPRGEARWNPDPIRLKALWFGHPSNIDTVALSLDELVIVGRQRPIALTIVTGWIPNLERTCADVTRQWGQFVSLHYIEWSAAATWRALAETDLVVIPTLPGAPDRSIKSPNRLVESLWAGRCVAANSLPSYLEFEQWAFIDGSLSRALRSALDAQESISGRIAAAQAYIAEHYSPEGIARQWEAVIAQAVEGRGRHRTGPIVEAPAAGAAPSAGRPPLRLNLGCGDKLLPGYVNVDVAESRAGAKPDVLCDLHALPMFGDDSADEILSVHVVEHFWRWEVLDVLREWVRVLRPGGRMVLECPNLISACQAFLADPDGASGPGQEGQRTMWVFYGDPAWRDPLMVHRWGYTPRSLARLMGEAGLVNVRQEPAEFKLREPRDMRVVGEKP